MPKYKKLGLEKEYKENAIVQIKKFFWNARDEEIGDLAAILILDFFTEKLAPVFYNHGIKDAIAFLNETTEDMYDLEI